MWSIFSRDPASSFGYDIGELCTGLEEKSLWKLHKGKKKANSDEVSILIFDLKNASEIQQQVAKSSFKRMKTLRHPNILTYIDGLETDKILYVVVEPVTPLMTYLHEHVTDGSTNEFAISWGIHQIVKSLSFLVKDCHLIHNNICLSSVFVNKAGEWLLGGLEYVYPSQGEGSRPPIKIMPLLEKYDPPEKATQRLKATEEWSTDMWGLGCLVWEVYNGPLHKTSDLKTLGKMPKTLTGNYATLVSANPKSRPSPAQFIEDCRRSGGFMANKFVDAMMFLDEIQIKDQAEKTAFLESLNSVVDDFPPSFCRHKILPQLIKAFEFGDAGANVLTPLLKVGKLLDANEYQRLVIPCIVKMFSSTDRQTRVKLLQQLGLYIEHVPITIVNDQIFPSVSLGFNDTNPLVRETTIKAMLHMASRLNYKNLNEELMRHFARLQTKDDQGGIRTNTTVCLGKIACYLNPQIRQKVLPSAYMRALRDPFAPARQATLLAMVASVQYFPIQELAIRLLPCVCPLTRDPEKTVRDQAFKAIETFTERLKVVSENPEAITELEKDLTSTTSNLSESQSWAGWAMTSVSSLSTLTSKLKSQAKISTPADTKAATSATSEAVPQAKKPIEDKVEASPLAQAQNDPDTEWDQSGWDDTGDDWAPIQDSQSLPRSSKKTAWEEENGECKDAWGEADAGWNDDWVADSEQLEFEPVESSHSLMKASAYNWDSKEKTTTKADLGDFFSTIPSESKPVVKPKTAQSNKTAMEASAQGGASLTMGAIAKTSAAVGGAAAESSDTSWDDAGDDWLSAGNQGSAADEEQKKKEREEKRLQRQKALAEKKAAKGGAMKLGTRKAAVD